MGAVTVVRTFSDFDAWLGAVATGRSKRHQLWCGAPGKGKTTRIHRHVRNTVGTDKMPHVSGRADAPIYSGRITPAKWYLRGWQHSLEPLLVLNDLHIPPRHADWEHMLTQYLESTDRRTIRWDIKTRADQSEDLHEITEYLGSRRLLEEFLRRYGRFDHPREAQDDAEEFEEEEGRPHPCHVLQIPRAYETETTCVIVANQLGDPERWARVHSRLRVFEWRPDPAEQVADMEAWDPAVPRAVLGVIESCHRRGEVMDLDYRAVEDAIEAFRLGLPWEDALRESFHTEAGIRTQLDADDILNWLLDTNAKVDEVITERDVYQRVGSLRGEAKKARLNAAIRILVERGWLTQYQPPAVLRPGRRGRRPSRSYRIQALPNG